MPQTKPRGQVTAGDTTACREPVPTTRHVPDSSRCSQVKASCQKPQGTNTEGRLAFSNPQVLWDLSWDPYRVDVTNAVHPISPSTCSAAPAAAEVCSALLSRALPSFLQLLLSSLRCSFNFLPSAAQRFGS